RLNRTQISQDIDKVRFPRFDLLSRGAGESELHEGSDKVACEAAVPIQPGLLLEVPPGDGIEIGVLVGPHVHRRRALGKIFIARPKQLDAENEGIGPASSLPQT